MAISNAIATEGVACPGPISNAIATAGHQCVAVGVQAVKLLGVIDDDVQVWGADLSDAGENSATLATSADWGSDLRDTGENTGDVDTTGEWGANLEDFC